MARGGPGRGRTPGRGGRGRGRSPASGRGRGRGKSSGNDAEAFGLDEVDAFHKQRDRVRLAVSDDEASDSEADSELEAAAYELNQSDGSESDASEAEDDEESEEEGPDDDAALQAAVRRGGRIGRLAKAAQAVGSKVKLQQGLDEEGAEDEDEDAALEARRQWGANKRAYHGADETDDEEAAQEEEAEALRLQREQAAALRPEDYDDSHLFPGADGGAEASSSDEEDAEPSMEAAAAAAQNGGVKVERIARDLPASVDRDTAQALVERDAPELLALLDELRSSLLEVRSRVGPVLSQVRAGEAATAEGLSYLEAKHLLLLSYCTHIVFYVLLKAEGAPVHTHPVIGRLLQLRTYLEKLRPIDKKLSYQIEKLLAAGQRAETDTAGEDGGGVDPLSYGPRPDQLVPRIATGNAAEAAADGGVYRPPRLAAVAMDPSEDPDARRSAKERRRERAASRRGGRSALLQELAAEVEDAPEEAGAGGGAGPEAGADSAGARRQLHALAARAAVEEDLMMRVPLSKEQRRSLKSQRRAALSGRGLTDEFADDVADLVNAAEGVAGRGLDVDDAFRRKTVSQKFGGEATTSTRGRSGDADVPMREALHERRAKFDSVRARRAAAAAVAEDEAGASGKRPQEVEPAYQAAAEAAAARKRARREARAVPATLPPLPDPAPEGARAINTAIEKNRGLTPHRNKAGKNPRKKNRTKFENATKRRGGQVQTMREPSAAYGGEATGIKAKISKSRRF